MKSPAALKTLSASTEIGRKVMRARWTFRMPVVHPLLQGGAEVLAASDDASTWVLFESFGLKRRKKNVMRDFSQFIMGSFQIQAPAAPPKKTLFEGGIQL